MLDNIQQQIADAEFLLAELPIGSPDTEYVKDWLRELRQAAERRRVNERISERISFDSLNRRATF